MAYLVRTWLDRTSTYISLCVQMLDTRLDLPDAAEHSGKRLCGALAVRQGRRHGCPCAALPFLPASGHRAIMQASVMRC